MHLRHVAETIFLLLVAVPAMVYGQGLGSIDEIIITAPRTDDRASPASLQLDLAALQEFQPVAVADVFRNLTGISMRTNSRGESVIRIRGAEERQTLVFLDGAPLATPWDGRTDLALLPAGLVDRVQVTRGAIALEYGTNAVAGAVDLTTFVPQQGTSLRAEAQRGSLGTQNLNTVAGLGLDNGWSFVLGASRIDRDAERIADRSSVVFDPTTTRERTNTDMSGSTAYLAAGYAGGDLSLRASVLHADVERGVAAQGDRDPATSSLRYWRTPEWVLTQATLNGTWDISRAAALRFTGWRQWFEQTIDAYSDYSYATLEEREQGQDDTVGGRLVLSFNLDQAAIRLVTTAQESTHVQQDSESDTGSGGDWIAAPELRYRQRLTTFGAEVDLPLGENLATTFGVARDRANTPLTGDKPAQDDLSAGSWSALLHWTPSGEWSVTASLGKRSRFPTPREMYGTALGRFLLNPDLGPERSLLADLGARRAWNDALWLDLALWANDSDNTLSQRIVAVDGVNMRQRFNTNGSLTYGIEAAATIALSDSLQAELSTAIQDGRMKRGDDGGRPPLLQRPDTQLRAALDWQPTSRLDLRAELLYTGDAYDLSDDDEILRLPDSTSVNLRGFLRLTEWRGRPLELTASIDNLTDALVLPQLGLPAPGRTIRVGLRLNN